MLSYFIFFFSFCPVWLLFFACCSFLNGHGSERIMREEGLDELRGVREGVVSSDLDLLFARRIYFQ